VDVVHGWLFTRQGQRSRCRFLIGHPTGTAVRGVRAVVGDERRKRRGEVKVVRERSGALMSVGEYWIGPLPAPIWASSEPKPFALYGTSAAASRARKGVGHVPDRPIARMHCAFACAVLHGILAGTQKRVARSATVRTARTPQRLRYSSASVLTRGHAVPVAPLRSSLCQSVGAASGERRVEWDDHPSGWDVGCIGWVIRYSREHGVVVVGAMAWTRCSRCLRRL